MATTSKSCLSFIALYSFLMIIIRKELFPKFCAFSIQSNKLSLHHGLPLVEFNNSLLRASYFRYCKFNTNYGLPEAQESQVLQKREGIHRISIFADRRALRLTKGN